MAYTVAHTIDCVFSTILNHGLYHGSLFPLFKFFSWKNILNQLEILALKSKGDAMNLTATFEVLGPLMLSFSNILHKMCHKVKVSTDHLLKIGKLKPLLFGIFYAKYSKTQHEGP